MHVNLSTFVDSLDLGEHYLPPAAPSAVQVLGGDGVDVAPDGADTSHQALHDLQPLALDDDEPSSSPPIDYEALLEEHLGTSHYYRRPQTFPLQRTNALHTDQPASTAGSEGGPLPSWHLTPIEIPTYAPLRRYHLALTPIDIPTYAPLRRYHLASIEDLPSPPISPLPITPRYEPSCSITPRYEPPSDLLQTALAVCDLEYIEWNNIDIVEEDIVVEGRVFDIGPEFIPCRMDVIQLPNHRLRAVSPPPNDRWWVSSSPPQSPDHPYARSVTPSPSRSSASQPSQQDNTSSSQAADNNSKNTSDKPCDNSASDNYSDSNDIDPTPGSKIVIPCTYKPSNLDISITDCQLANPRGKISPPFKELKFGSLPNISTSDHVVNSIIKDGLKLFLPSISCKDYTPSKYQVHVNNLLQSGVLSEVPLSDPKPKMLFRLFPVPKADPHNPRIIIDFKKLTKHLNPPSFKLPNILKLMQSHRDSDFMIKLDLMNGFFHIPLHKSAMRNMGIKCGKKYYHFNRLPQGLALAPYYMQRVMCSIIQSYVKDIDVKFLVYLDDFLFLGSKPNLELVISRLMNSNLLFNEPKCILSPTKQLQYLGVNINLNNKSVALTEKFISNLKNEISLIKGKILSLRYKQRIAGLINFARHILKLPLSIVSMGFFHPDKLVSLMDKFHSNEVMFYSKLSKFKVWCDATPTQIGIFSERDKRVSLFRRVGNILDNEYIGILISHLLYPQDIIINDNRAAVCLFTRGKLPPDLRDSFNLSCVLCHVYHDPVVVWVPSAHNLADRYSRFNFVT